MVEERRPHVPLVRSYAPFRVFWVNVYEGGENWSRTLGARYPSQRAAEATRRLDKAIGDPPLYRIKVTLRVGQWDENGVRVL